MLFDSACHRSRADDRVRIFAYLSDRLSQICCVSLSTAGNVDLVAEMLVWECGLTIVEHCFRVLRNKFDLGPYTRYYQKTSRTPMNSLNLQDTKLIHRNLLHFHTLTTKDQKWKLRKQSHLPSHQKE